VSGFKLEKEAKQAEYEFLKQLDEGKINLDDSSLFSEIAENFLNYIEKSPDYAKGTVCNYKGYYNNHLQMLHNMKAKNINEDILNTWVESEIKNGVSPQVINSCRKFGMAVFTYHKKTYKFNPFSELDKRKEPKILRNRLSLNQLLEMKDICEENLPDFYLIFCMACLVGMRLGEYSALTVENIHPERNEIFIKQQYTRGELKARTKTDDSTRIAKYPNQLNEIIKWHRKKFGVFSGFLFKGKDENKPISQKTISRRFAELLKLCGLSENYMRVHDLRGQYVDLMHTADIPISFISKNIGHSGINITNNTYTSILNELKDSAMEKLGNMVFK